MRQYKGINPQAPYRLGIALSGGSVKGFAHIGVLKYLEEVAIHPDIIAGTSAGALVGAFYADGFHPVEILEVLRKMSFRTMTSLAIGKGGLLGVESFAQLLKRNLRHKKIEDLLIPLRIVATDLDAGDQKVFDQGDIIDRVVASCSIPVLFRPRQIDGVNYVDGGLFRNLPVSVIKSDCQKVIGVDLNPEVRDNYKTSLTGVAHRSWDLVFRQNAIYDRKLADILLETPEVTRFGMFEVKSAEEIMHIGYEMADKGLRQYHKLLS